MSAASNKIAVAFVRGRLNSRIEVRGVAALRGERAIRDMWKFLRVGEAKALDRLHEPNMGRSENRTYERDGMAF